MLKEGKLSEEVSKPNYYGILPAEVRYANITSSAKVLYAEITCLTLASGYCWASNKYFQELFGVGQQAVSSWVSELVKGGFIRIDGEPGQARKIYLVMEVNAKKRRGGTQKGVSKYTKLNNSVSKETELRGQAPSNAGKLPSATPTAASTKNRKELLEVVNTVLGKKFRVLPERGVTKLLATFSLEEIKIALTALKKDEWHAEHLPGLKIDYLIRSTTIDKFLSAGTPNSATPPRERGRGIGFREAHNRNNGNG